MKKFLVSFILIAALIIPTCINSLAASPAKNGIYEVPIEIRKSDGTSIADEGSVFAQTALLEISNGKKHLTIVSPTSIIGLQLNYYTNGTVSGNTSSCEIVKNVKIGETTYPGGYRFPISGTGQLVGIMIKLPFAPVSVSARIYIDYDKAVYISELEDTTTGNTPGSTSKSEFPTFSGGSSHTYEYPYALDKHTTSGQSINDYKGGANEADTTSSSEITENFEDETKETKVMKNVKKKQDNTGVIVGGVILAVVIIGLAAWMIISRSKESH